jgi:hypothetical protein
MPNSLFTFERAFAYFVYRLPQERITRRDAVAVHCPFHADKSASMSLNLAKAVWNCHGCNEHGGTLDFERKMMGSDTETAWKEIYRITGMEAPKQGRKIAKLYDYTDVRGRLLYQKVRYEPKGFAQRAPVCDATGKRIDWRYNLDDVKKGLYRLPEVLTAKLVVICEAKDCENLQAALGADWVTTTNFDGAGKWKDDYSPYFTGRLVLVLPDNDAVGMAHAETVAASVSKYAHTVKIVRIPDLPEHGDVSDWLAVGHTGEEFLTLAC